jgi:hypothetical protein
VLLLSGLKIVSNRILITIFKKPASLWIGLFLFASIAWSSPTQTSLANYESKVMSAEQEGVAWLELTWKSEAFWLSSGLFLQLSGDYLLKQGRAPSSLEAPSHLLPWDRHLWGRDVELAGQLSNVMSWPVVGFWALQRMQRSYGLTQTQKWQHLVILTEIMLWQSGINLWTRQFGLWPRPLVGNPQVTQRTPQMRGSFYSGHASAAFALASFMHWELDQSQAKYKTQWKFFYYTTATTIAALRVVAGKHYYTDVVVGGIIGVMISRFIINQHVSQTASTTSSLLWVPKSNGLELWVRF